MMSDELLLDEFLIWLIYTSRIVTSPVTGDRSMGASAPGGECRGEAK